MQGQAFDGRVDELNISDCKSIQGSVCSVHTETRVTKG